MRRRKRRHAAHVNHERWLVSYADFITLLFAVFVVLYAAAHVDNSHIGDISHAIHTAFKDLGVFQTTNSRTTTPGPEIVALNRDSAGETGADPAELRKLLANTLAPEISKKQAELRDGPDGLVISLQEIGLYDQGSDILKEASTGPLSRVAEVLKPTKLRIRIEGHTDDVPIHNARFASNWELSSSRATGLVRLFIEQYGLDPERLAAAGYAEYHPIQPNTTVEGRRLNRRVDIVVLDPPKRKPTPVINTDLNQTQQAATAAGIIDTRTAVSQPSSGH
jgi:chemotaxis protein MotB